MAAWAAPVVIPTYLPEAASRYPAYLDRRVYQGSSGRVYPLPFHDRISEACTAHSWLGLHLENSYLRVLVLPELGGRIHLAVDKRTGQSMFYANPVIKPALVGLTGPWLAGGIEFNWPQHHRPATFLPTAWSIDEVNDEATVWCSDHDPFARMKGMHGVRLTAGSTLLELQVRLFNRSDEPQTFLWWANVAAEVHADYQSFFPEDVELVADHAKRAVSTFPTATGTYYGVDYPKRRGLDTRQDSPRRVPGDRLDWYRNIPVPTSYMCLDSVGDFFGGYDHRSGAGFVHCADHHYAVGKKQWSWGDAPFGHAWNKNLTDDDSAYIELMAGVYTDNQPDFSHLAPGETKAFSQFWYPVAGTGPVVAATLHAALGVSVDSSTTTLAWDVTQALPEAVVSIHDAISGALIEEVAGDLTPEGRLQLRLETNVPVQVGLHRHGDTLLSWSSPMPRSGLSRAMAPAKEPPPPDRVMSVEELYLTGRHLLQYRHATRSPEPYWIEALRRDPGHAGSHTALAARRYEEALYPVAEEHLRAAIARLTNLNPNPVESEAHYRLGLTLLRLGQAEEAYAAFAKATWTRAWCAPGYHQMAIIDAKAGRNGNGLSRVEAALRAEPHHLQARNLTVVLLRRQGRTAEADRELATTLELDPLDLWACQLAGQLDPAKGQLEAQALIDIAVENVRIGEYWVALELFGRAREGDADRPLGQTGCEVLADYHAAAVLDRLGDGNAAAATRARARGSDRTWNFPARLDDVQALQDALAADQDDPTAAALLGHWLYAHGQPDQAVQHWQRSVAADPRDAVVWRNLAIAHYNHQGDVEAAVAAYNCALENLPGDPQLWFESDQLLERTGAPAAERLRRLEQAPIQAGARDDLRVEHAHLLLTAGRLEEALQLLRNHRFQPWEGGKVKSCRCGSAPNLLWPTAPSQWLTAPQPCPT